MTGSLVATTILMVWSSLAIAAPPELIAVHPLQFVGSADEYEQYEFDQTFIGLLGEIKMNQVEPETVQRFLSSFPGDSCGGTVNLNKCLGDLARGTQAGATLYVVVRPFGDKPSMFARLVSADGKVIVEPGPKEFAWKKKGSKQEVLKKAIKKYMLEDVHWNSLTLPPVAAEPIAPATLAAAPSARQTAPSNPKLLPVEGRAVTSQPRNLNIKAIVSYSVAGAALVTGAVVYLTSLSEMQRQDKLLHNGSVIPASAPEAQRIHDDLAIRSGLIIGAGALTVAAAALGTYFLLDPNALGGSKSAPKVAFGLTPSGGSFLISGNF